MKIWKILRDHAKRMGKVETTLLGSVGCIETETGELTGYIPPELQSEAKANGLRIVAAFWKDGRYLLVSNMALRRGATGQLGERDE